MQQDWDESPPDDEPIETSDSAGLAGSEADTPPLDEPIASEEDGNDTAADDSAGMAVIRAIEESLARPEGESPAPTAANAAAPLSPSMGDAQAANAAEDRGEAAAPLASEAGPPLTAEAKARAAMGPPRPFQWSPFMQLALGDTPVANSMDQGYVERPWTSVNPPTTEAAVAPAPFVRPETGTGAAPAISVYVQVHLSDDAIRRVAETTVREAAAKSQHQIEIVAKRLHKLELDLIFQAMERRRLYR